MTPQLKALLVAVGVSIVGAATYTMYVPAPGVTMAMLTDAGANAGTQREALCRMWRQTDAGIEYRRKEVPGVLFNADKAYATSKKFIPDGWIPFKVGTVSDVTTTIVDAGVLPDGGQLQAPVYTYGPTHGLAIFDCVPAPAQILNVGEDERDITDECACAPATGDGGVVVSTCEYLAPDGGWVPAPRRVNFTAGSWRGACLSKSCTELAGATTWPTGCGPESLPGGQ